MPDDDYNSGVSMLLSTEEDTRARCAEIAARALQGRLGPGGITALLDLAAEVYRFVKEGPPTAAPP